MRGYWYGILLKNWSGVFQMIKKNIDVPLTINVNIDGIVISEELLSEAIDYLELINRQYLKNGDILYHDDLIDKLKKARGDDDV